MAVAQETLYFFPPAPSPDAVEWSGTPIGRSNVVTRTRSRTRQHNKMVDATPGLRERLINSAIAHIVRHAGREPIALHDVVIHGIRVRAITNSAHLIEFWRQNWYDPEEWQRLTGTPAPKEPQAIVYALGGVEGEEEAAYYSRETNTIVFFNTSYYGQLKSWVLGAVGRILAAKYGIHSIHGACVEHNGAGILYIAPTGTGKSTSSYGLIDHPGSRFHSDDWVYVRYARVTKSGLRLVPLQIQSASGDLVEGFRCHQWLAENPCSKGTAYCLDLNNQEITVDLAEFDLSQPLEAYAYTSEKIFYLRSNLVENFPDAADAILRADLENVPAPSPDFLETNRAMIDNLVSEVRASKNTGVQERLAGLPEEKLRWLIAALFAFDNARAMLDIGEVLPQSRIFTNPMEPVQLTRVFLLKRDPSDSVVLQALPLDRFMERLLIGQTPDGRREIAYNAYRAVDDATEQKTIQTLEGAAAKDGVTLYREFLRAPSLPNSLIEEFTLFRYLYEATLCYDCNTILQRDPLISSKKEAVRLTLQLVLRGCENRDRNLTLTLENYRQHLRG
jgi:hypothetical protein